MKKIIVLLFVLFSFVSVFSQPVIVRTTGTNTVSDGRLIVPKNLVVPRYADTTAANVDKGIDSCGAIIFTYSTNTYWIRACSPKRWVQNNAGGGSNITIYNDSTLLICNLNGCDTFRVSNITINNFHILNDSTIQVCDTTGTCDTINISPTPFNKTFVDSVKVSYSPDTVAIDTIHYYIGGNKFTGGYIIGRKDTIYVQYPLYVYTDTLGHRVIAIKQQDGIITPGYVTWIHDSTFYVTSATYVINGKYYVSPADSVTVSGIDPTYPIKFQFIVDTTGHAGYIAGVAAPIPLDPQIDPASQLALTTGITFLAGATSPANVTLQTIYDENAGTPTEWAYSTSGTLTANANSTVNPFHLTKDIFVQKYSNGAKINFISASIDTVSNGDILKGWIYFNGAFTNSFKFQLFNGTTAVSNALTIQNTFGLNPNDSNKYQLFAIPISAFTFSSPYYNKLVITHVGSDNSGAKGYYIDYVQLQRGVIPVTPPTDYSHKTDSAGTYKINDSVYVTKYWVNGISHIIGDTIKIHATGGGGGGTGTVTSISQAYGIINTPNPITSTGTIAVDSATLSLTYLRRKDSTLYTTVYQNSLKQNLVTLTTTGTSGSATFNQGTGALNIPSYSAGTGTVTSIATGYGLSGGTITSTGTIIVDTSLIHSTLWNNAAYQGKLTLTTTGTSGAATLTGNTLNIPQYSGGTGGTTSTQTFNLTGGSKVATFTSVPATYSDYEIFRWGVRLYPATDYTTSGNNVTILDGEDGEHITFQEIK